MPVAAPDIPLWLVGPFVLLLALIAIMPLTPPRLKHWYEAYYPHLAIGLGLLVVGYYWLRIPDGGHTVAHTAHEYVSFIVLIGSLFVVAGGILLKVGGEATPLGNVAFLAVGAVLANVIGTTGVSMVLIRPWLRMNRRRIRPFHVVFFIFIVSNVGGSLTPIGDPPLFLGYLRGVPFFWLVEHVMTPWLVTLGLLLAVFWICDWRNFARTPPPAPEPANEDRVSWGFDGSVNVLLMIAVVGGVFLPARFFVREIVMLAAAVTSYVLTPRRIHGENAFTFAPIKEVGFLFAGIFATMMPALNFLETHGASFGFVRPLQYYFATGGLSAVLDNAPTYVNFLQLAQATAKPGPGAATVPMLLVERPDLVIAVSLGAVFFGAMTYIGNGPNFMVRSIAEAAGVGLPTFFGFIFKYSLPILLPILVVVGVLFL